MKKLIKNLDYIGAAYLGGSVYAFANISLLNWEWWAIVIPTLLIFILYFRLNQN